MINIRIENNVLRPTIESNGYPYPRGVGQLEYSRSTLTKWNSILRELLVKVITAS